MFMMFLLAFPLHRERRKNKRHVFPIVLVAQTRGWPRTTSSGNCRPFFSYPFFFCHIIIMLNSGAEFVDIGHKA